MVISPQNDGLYIIRTHLPHGLQYTALNLAPRPPEQYQTDIIKQKDRVTWVNLFNGQPIEYGV